LKKSLTIKETGEELGVHPRTIQREIQRGEIQSFKVGTARRIAAEEIERLKKRQQALE